MVSSYMLIIPNKIAMYYNHFSPHNVDKRPVPMFCSTVTPDSRSDDISRNPSAKFIGGISGSTAPQWLKVMLMSFRLVVY